MNLILRNNTANKKKDELINGFVVRTKPFTTIFSELSLSTSNKPEQNYLIIGQRGAGKTTLLYRLKYEIEDHLTDKTGVIPVMLSEEQYNLNELADLWEHIAILLKDAGYFTDLPALIEKSHDSSNYEVNYFDLLETRLKKEKKKIIVFIENIDVFFKKIGKPGQKRLREVLMTSPYIRFICSATTYFEGVTDYSMPFYSFFKVIELKGLTLPEAKDLLLSIGDVFNRREEIELVLERNPKRLESLRRLTGGVPRTISYLFDIFLDNKNGKAIKDIYRLMDDLTFLYKSELDQLSAQQQKVIDVIARNWDAIAVKDIVGKTRFESKQISSILQALEKNQIIEKVSTKSKNNLYRIKERFMNIWYLMRFGKVHEKESVIWLVRFYDTWCDKTELAKHVYALIKNIKEGTYDQQAALYLGNTFLTCENVTDDLRYDIYKSTKAVLPKDSIDALRYTDKDLYQRIRKFIKEKSYDKAISALEDIGKQDEKFYFFSSFVYGMAGDYSKAEEFGEEFLKLSPESKIGAYRLGMLNFKNLNNPNKAVEYFERALELNEPKAALYLGQVYSKNGNNEKALEYFKRAAESNVIESYVEVAILYSKQGEFASAEPYWLQAKEHFPGPAYMGLGLISELQGKFKPARKYYEMALEKGMKRALLTLAHLELHKRRPNRLIVAKYLQQAVVENVEDARLEQATFFLRDPSTENQGIIDLQKLAADGESTAAHRLGHFYSDNGQFAESDEYFEKAYQLGRKTAAFCQALEILDHGRIDSKARALELFESNANLLGNVGTPYKLAYAVILLWNDRIEEAQRAFQHQLEGLNDVFNSQLEHETGLVLMGTTQYICYLIAKGLTRLAHAYFQNDQGVDFKQALKPVYYALMHYMKDEFPFEYLKAGDELKDTVDEIVAQIEKIKKQL